MPRSQHNHHRSARAAFTMAVAAVPVLAGGLAVGAGSSPAAAAASIVIVRPSQSIQDALDRAAPRTTIIVTGGVHAEQLTISTDGITLIGVGTRLVPPPVAVDNTCTGLAGDAAPGVPSQAGICVTGADVNLAPFDME